MTHHFLYDFFPQNVKNWIFVLFQRRLRCCLWESKKNKLRSEAIVHYMLFIFCDTMIEKTIWIDSVIFSTFIINLQFDNFLQYYYNNIYWTLKNNVSTLLFKKWIHLYLFMIMLFIIKIVLMKLENNSIIYTLFII